MTSLRKYHLFAIYCFSILLYSADAGSATTIKLPHFDNLSEESIDGTALRGHSYPVRNKKSAGRALLIVQKKELLNTGANALPKDQQAVDIHNDRFSLPEEPPAPVYSLSLKEAVAIAIVKNNDIIVERLAPMISETEIQKEQGAFDPTLTADLYDDHDSAREVKGSLEVSKKFIPGSTFTVTYESADTGVATAASRYKSGITLKLSQSLLKNFGSDINLTKIMVAANTRDQSYSGFIKKVVDVVSEVQSVYWELYSSLMTLITRRDSFDLSRNLYRKKKIEARLGALAPIDLVEIESDLASKVTAFHEAEKNLRESEIKLKTLLGMPLSYEGKVVSLVPSDIPEFEEQTFDFNESLGTALSKHPDYQKLLSKKRSKEIELKYYKNQQLPDLDASISYELEKTTNEWLDSMALTASRSKGIENYKLELKLTLPLGNNSSRADYIKNNYEYMKINAEVKQLESTLKKDIASNLIAVQERAKIVKTSTDDFNLKERNLKAFEKKLLHGTTNLKDLLDTQTAFIDARLKVIESKTEYEKALINLYKAQGIINPKFEVGILEDEG